MRYNRISRDVAILAVIIAIGSTIFISCMWFSQISEPRLDSDLAKVIKVFNLRPLQVRRFSADPKFMLGQALFFDPVLSGPRDVACATCHLLKYGTSDGLTHSIGVHAIGLGRDRRLIQSTPPHIRHALDLWNRDNNAVRALFWDGRVEALDPEHHIFRSPLGKDLPTGLENALAVQALFPLVTPEEMLGFANDRSAPNLPNGHASLPDELIADPGASEHFRMTQSHTLLVKRLLGGDVPTKWQDTYRMLFEAAYPRKKIFTIVDLANAIAHFEEMAFATRDSSWDRYLSGDLNALDDNAKRGALVFYGKGRCAVCHSGPLFSDFKYHSIGVFETRQHSPDMVEDFGRWNATHNEKDRYKFRTPPLRNVTKTAPYFHNGSELSLRAAIIRHLDPLDRADKYNPDGSFVLSLGQINAVSPVLVPSIQLSKSEIQYLLEFLDTLDYSPTNVDVLVPRNVPSGLLVQYEE